MIRNYLKMALRTLMKYKFISFINFFGLTIGFSCCLLLLAFVLFELSYDRHHSNAENIYRVERTFIDSETGIPYFDLPAVAPPVGPLLKNDFADIKLVTRLHSNGTTTFRYEDKLFNERDVFFADEFFTGVFDVEMVKGSPENSLREPFSVMLSEEIARKYFGRENPLGKVLELDKDFTFKVTGVYKAFPAASHVHPRVLLSFSSLENPAIYGEEYLRTRWGSNNFFTYLLLPEGYNAEALEAQLPGFLNRHLGKEESGASKPSDWNYLRLKPLKDIHLHSQNDSELEEGGDLQRVYIFSAIAFFILLIACINYMNMATARSVLRAKEVGVRKVIGAGRSELITQFLSESVLTACIAALLAVGFTWLVFPWLKETAGVSLSIGLLLRWEILVPLLLLPVAVGILSGIYPALFLSSFQPVKVLKGFTKKGSGGVSFRQALVVVQFGISIILIVSTMVVLRQLQYMQDKALGYEREQVVKFLFTPDISDNFDAFRQELLSSSYIKEVARSSRLPTDRLMDGSTSSMSRGDSLLPVKANIREVEVDSHFMETYGIKLAAGRMFSTNLGADSAAFILNETAVREMGLKSAEDAVGRAFLYRGTAGRVVGVVKDFHFESLHQRIKPVVFFKAGAPGDYNRVAMKISGKHVKEALAHLLETYSTFDADTPIEYEFIDEAYAQLYKSEKRQGVIFTTFSCVAIVIACLGLFGLSAFTISQRVKEIGIRKILGAGTTSIVALLSKDILKLVALAVVVAFPIAWYTMHKWLEDFAYRIDVPVWVFLAAGVAAAVIAFLTISYHTVKAATANPVKNLRTE